jgi:hypothetical protein
MESLSFAADLLFALGADFVRLSKSQPYVLEQMGVQRVSGQSLSFYASISWKLRVPINRWPGRC